MSILTMLLVSFGESSTASEVWPVALPGDAVVRVAVAKNAPTAQPAAKGLVTTGMLSVVALGFTRTRATPKAWHVRPAVPAPVAFPTAPLLFDRASVPTTPTAASSQQLEIEATAWNAFMAAYGDSCGLNWNSSGRPAPKLACQSGSRRARVVPAKETLLPRSQSRSLL